MNDTSRERGLWTGSFVVAVVLLGAAAVLAGPVNKWLAVQLTKRPLPLKAPFSALDESALRPYKKVKVVTLTPEIVDALGTEQYLYWIMDDTTKAANDPLRRANLFITYYSGGPNFVPHTPDVCYLGSGYQPIQPHETIEVVMPSLNDRFPTVPIRVLTFGKTAIFDMSTLSVVYTFGCNGEFAGDRERIRVLIHRPRNKYAYFSKVEVSFPGATREQTVEGAKKLFNLVLPILVRDHWPDFEAAERGDLAFSR